MKKMLVAAVLIGMSAVLCGCTTETERQMMDSAESQGLDDCPTVSGAPETYQVEVGF